MQSNRTGTAISKAAHRMNLLIFMNSPPTLMKQALRAAEQSERAGRGVLDREHRGTAEARAQRLERLPLGINERQHGPEAGLGLGPGSQRGELDTAERDAARSG